MRRTVKVTRLIEIVNRHNRDSKGDPGIRRGANTLLETVLHESGVYAGFGYLTEQEVPAGELPGIVRGNEIAPNQFPDETRVFYYQHRRLR
jgi:hypothetical protein